MREAVAGMVGQRDAGWSFFPMLDHKGTSHYLIAIWTYGRIEVQFQNMLRNPPFDDETKRLELLRRLNDIPHVTIPTNAITVSEYPLV